MVLLDAERCRTRGHDQPVAHSAQRSVSCSGTPFTTFQGRNQKSGAPSLEDTHPLHGTFGPADEYERACFPTASMGVRSLAMRRAGDAPERLPGHLSTQDHGTPMLDRTDSYCERCGTLYAFRVNAPRTLSLKGARVLAKGLKNFVLTDGQSMNDAMALARHEDEHEDTTRMTEAFHRTFNFCMTCRQYACASCWNSRQGACLTCAPEQEVEPVAPQDHLIVRTPVGRHGSEWDLFPDLPDTVRPPAEDALTSPMAWPAQDLDVSAPGPANGEEDHRPGQSIEKLADQEAWNLWPIADEIAPEMTLTPEELQLVEARLGVEQPAPDAPAAKTPPPPPDRSEIPAAETSAPESALPDEPAATSEPAPPLPEEQSLHTVDRLATPSDAHPATPTPIPDMAGPKPGPRQYTAYEQPQAGARLLGAMAPSAEGETAAGRPEPPSRGRQAGVEPWPQATPWLERTIHPFDWSDAAASTTDLPPAASAEADYAARPEEALPAEADGLEIDTEELAPVRLSAPEPAAPEPAPTQPAVAPAAPSTIEPVPLHTKQQTLFELIPPTHDAAPGSVPQPPMWPPAGRDAVAARSSIGPSQANPDGAGPVEPIPPSQAPEEPAPWPPLGASWPPQEAPGAPWPPPETPSIPAALAAREAAAPVFAEMWAQSSQEVLSRGTVRVCHHCALPVSTQARFCRRCGTKQA
jgi:hypothetical protein